MQRPENAGRHGGLGLCPGGGGLLPGEAAWEERNPWNPVWVVQASVVFEKHPSKGTIWGYPNLDCVQDMVVWVVVRQMERHRCSHR